MEYPPGKPDDLHNPHATRPLPDLLYGLIAEQKKTIQVCCLSCQGAGVWDGRMSISNEKGGAQNEVHAKGQYSR